VRGEIDAGVQGQRLGRGALSDPVYPTAARRTKAAGESARNRMSSPARHTCISTLPPSTSTRSSTTSG
jgi:hypothetical protein